MSSKKIALVGCGVWGQKILKELVALGAKVSVYEIDPKLYSFSESLGADDFNISWGGMSDCDGVILATPSSQHKNHIEAVIPYGIPIFVEKPLTTNIEDALYLKELNTDNIFLMHTWAYHPAILELKKIYLSRRLGELKSIHSTRGNWTSPRKDVDSLWNLAPHDLTIAKTILGYMPEPVFATADRYNGIIRSFWSVLGNNPSFIFEVSNRYESKVREIRLNFELGVIRFEGDESETIKIINGDANCPPENINIEHVQYSKQTALSKQISEFLNYLDGGCQPRESFNDGLEIIRVIQKLSDMATY
jgi:predicted dehydrogenase